MPGTYSQEAIAAHFADTNNRLAQIEAHLVLVSEKLGIPYSPPLAAVPADVVALARTGDRLGAIRRYREVTGASLEEAKEAVVGL